MVRSSQRRPSRVSVRYASSLARASRRFREFVTCQFSEWSDAAAVALHHRARSVPPSFFAPCLKSDTISITRVASDEAASRRSSGSAREPYPALGEHASRTAPSSLADAKTISVKSTVRGVSEQACIIKGRMRRGSGGKKGESERAEEFGMDWGVGVIIKKG